jgi:predicted component of type VI protein secretion system
MNYVLQVVRGRSATTTLKLEEGVTSLGRHDDCLIRIKSSQVSRRHCEVFESGGRLNVRDLGSSNGTFVNGKRVMGQQPLKPGDELTIGAVTLRVATLGPPAATASPGDAAPKPKAGDTAVVDAIPVEDDEEEFEIEFDEDELKSDTELIPLADQEVPEPPGKPPGPQDAAAAKKVAETPAAATPAQRGGKAGTEDEAVAQFLLDLNLDDAD